MSRRGLPSDLRMRHDAHYVEELAAPMPTPVGRMIPVESLEPNPDQPRVEIGDLSELINSVSDRGVLEPLLVKPVGGSSGRWMIIAGERRWRAAKAAGLHEVPCIEMDIDDRSIAEIALIENLQRKDLTVWEEADGLLALCERFGYTHDDVAKRIGKSRSSVTEVLSIAALPKDIREQCQDADIHAKSLLLQIVRQPDQASMVRLTKDIIDKRVNRSEARLRRGEASNPKQHEKEPHQPTLVRFKSNEGDFQLELKFKRSVVETKDVLSALEIALDYYRKNQMLDDRQS